MVNHDTHGWLTAAFLREMSGLEGKAMFECVSSWLSKMNEHIKYAASCGPTIVGSCCTQKKKNLKQMLRDLVEEAGRWDVALKPTSLWWTSTYDPEERINMTIYTTTGCHKFTFEEKFKILVYAMNRQGKSHDAIEERMQSATKAFCGRIF